MSPAVALIGLGALLMAGPALAQAHGQTAAGTTSAQLSSGFSGAPRFEHPEGWSLKPRGRVQLDAGYVSAPDGVDDPALGFGTVLRRARLGVEGTIPGGLDYVAEVDLADGELEVTDLYLNYDASERLSFRVGQFNNFQALDRVTSANFTTFMERAAFSTAFDFERRLGVAASWSAGPLRLDAGVFTDNLADLDEAGGGIDRPVSLDGRIVYAPRAGKNQWHLGGSAHWRNQRGLADAGVVTRYGQEPKLRTTSLQFLETPELSVAEELKLGGEAAWVRGPFHAAGEVHWLRPELRGGSEDPTFFGGYAEIGYFLTGETRGYSSGRFGRTRVLRPVGSGGFGAVQLALRYDHLDLTSGTIRGGRQDALLLGLTWIPQDHVRFLLNYGRLSYTDAAVPGPGGSRDYSVDVVGARAQIDF